ncbi:hypothetical protein EJB05_16136, partial [Eragrostis curvula]
MAERKVINKHYPDDFDPSKIPRRRRPANGQIKVRTMLPMTLRCASCGAYLGRGTKFNARKEDAAGERYLGAIQVYRFYIRCTRCAAEIAFKTDPASSRYAVESGATTCRDEGALQREVLGKRRRDDGEEAAAGDAMAALEDRARDGKREMEADAALEEARSLSVRRAGVTPEQLLESLMNRGREAQRQELERADEALVKSVGFRSSSTGCVVKRIEEDNDEDEDFFEACLAKTAAADRQARTKQAQAVSPLLAIVSRKRRRVSVASDGKAPIHHAVTPPEARASAGEAKASNGALQVLCCSYGDGSDNHDES